MKTIGKYLIGAFATGLFAAGALMATAQVLVPQVTSIGSGDLVQIIPNGQPQAGNVYANALQFGTYGNTLPGGNYENALIGGDFGTNLFQRGASVGSITTTITYTADRWAAWSGAATTITATQQTGATDITAGYLASLRLNKGSGAGVIPVCVTQEVATANSMRFQGQTAEFDFHAKAGPNFSAAASNLNVSIVYGTGTDEGISKLAFQFNAGGGGSSTWTGQTNAASNLSVPITTGWARYGVVAAIPATATELAVIICYTPVGTGVAGDWFEFTGAQLAPNSALTTVAGASGAVLGPNDTRQKSFARRPASLETTLQQAYFYRLTESAAITPVAPCSAVDTTHTNCLIQFPVTMRTTPTMTYTAGFASPTSTTQATLGACSALATSTVVTSTAVNPLNALVYCTATTIPAAGVASFLYSNNGAGVISASAEL